MTDKNKKLKFHESNLDRELEINKIVNVPGMLSSTQNHQSSNIDIETNLLRPDYKFKKKSLVELDKDEDNEGEDYRNFSVKAEKKNSRESSLVYNHMNVGYKGNGRGFGDDDISSKLRYGVDSRQNLKTARTQDLQDYRFEYLNPDFSDPAKNVLPFARGGIDTRNLDKYRK